MLFILLHIVFSSFFVLCVRWTQRRNEDVLIVGAVNYIIAAAGAAVVLSNDSTAAVTLNTVLVGGFGGVFYFTAFLFLIVAASWKGAANTTVVSRLSILMPIAIGAFVWQEWPGRWQISAIGLACLSLLLIGRKANKLQDAIPPRNATLMLAAFFVCGGCCRLAPEIFKNVCAGHENSSYNLILFGVTAIASVVVLAVRGKQPKRAELFAGTAMGAANLAQSFCMIYALQTYDGFVVFPMSAAGSLVFTTCIATLMLDERLTRSSLTGVAIAAFALFMLRPSAEHKPLPSAADHSSQLHQVEALSPANETAKLPR